MKHIVFLINCIATLMLLSSCDTNTLTYTLTQNYGWGNIRTREVEANHTCILETPIHDGYTFLGWTESFDTTYTYDQYGDIIEESIVFVTSNCVIMDCDKTVFAVWDKIPEKFSLTFCDSGKTKTNIIEYGIVDITTINPITNREPDYTFRGWSLAENGPIIESNFLLKENTYLYAIWEQAIFNITFDLNGGVGIVPNKLRIDKGDYLETTSLPDNSGFSYSIYTFGGWSETKNGKPITSDFMPDKDMTLYAVWLQDGEVKDKTDDN